MCTAMGSICYLEKGKQDFKEQVKNATHLGGKGKVEVKK